MDELWVTSIFDFTGRTVVVTGSARGVGRAIAASFRDAGATVYLVDVDAEPVECTAREIGAIGLVADVSDTGQSPARGAGDSGDRTDRRPREQRRDPA